MKGLVERKDEFPILLQRTYLDHAGSSLPSVSLMDLVNNDLKNNLYCNPHSAVDGVGLETAKIRECRQRVLKFVGASEHKYKAAFTSGTTQSLKIVAENLLSANENATFYYMDECHTSVVGMRDLAAQHKCFNREELDSMEPGFFSTPVSVIAFPAMSNFCGFKYNVRSWVRKLRNIEKSFSVPWKIYIVLDVACFVTSNFLDLSEENDFDPDYIVFSFYKIFGFPTGVGTLIIKNNSLDVLLNRKKFFGGGVVEMSTVRKSKKVLKRGVEGLEDGTLPYHQIIASLYGFRYIESIGLANISRYTFELAQECYQQFKTLRYKNGNPLVSINSSTEFNDLKTQGPIINFNILNSDGSHSGFLKLSHLASAYRLYIRVGCFCNIGACQRYLGMNDSDIEDNFGAGHICGDNMDLIDGRPSGSIRVSFGFYNNLNDVNTFVQILKVHYINHPLINPTLSRDHDKPISLKNIFVYPIKSCGAFSPEEWFITQTGLLYDRQWMIVQGNTILTQKSDSLLALIKPIIDLERQYLKLQFKEDKEYLIIPLERDLNKEKIITSLSKVCGEEVSGLDEGKKASEWLENILGLTNLKLLRLYSRESMKNLSNSADFLILNETSIKELAAVSSMKEVNIPWMMNQFRSNLVFEGGSVYEETKWEELKSTDGITFKVIGPCNRCKMLSLDQETGETSLEPIRTLATELGNKTNFGVLATCVLIEDRIKLRIGHAFQAFLTLKV